MRIFLIGHTGQLGTDIKNEFQDQELVLSDTDITDYEKISSEIISTSPDLLISTAAFHEISECHKNPAKALAVNVKATKNLAKTCKEINLPFIWISSEMAESSDTVYGLTKFMGETKIKKNTDKYYIIRTANLYGKKGAVGKGGRNFPKTIREKAKHKKKIKVKADVLVSPTYTKDLAKAIRKLMDYPYGLYNIVNKGKITLYDFAKLIVPEYPIEAIYTEPTTKIQDNSLKNTGPKMPTIKNAVKRYLNEVK